VKTGACDTSIGSMLLMVGVRYIHQTKFFFVRQMQLQLPALALPPPCCEHDVMKHPAAALNFSKRHQCLLHPAALPDPCLPFQHFYNQPPPRAAHRTCKHSVVVSLSH
jgi:hypothetical protein